MLPPNNHNETAFSLTRSVTVEDEELTPETVEALDRAKASLARGEGIPHEEILREFNLSR